MKKLSLCVQRDIGKEISGGLIDALQLNRSRKYVHTERGIPLSLIPYSAVLMAEAAASCLQKE